MSLSDAILSIRCSPSYYCESSHCRCVRYIPKSFAEYGPRHASNEADAKSRAARRDKILSEMMHGEKIPTQGIYPGLGERWYRPREKQVALAVSARSFQRLTEKIVRGIHYIETDGFIESTHVIDFHVLSDEGAAPIVEVLDRFGTEYARGPGIIIKRAVTPEDNVSALVSIEVWNSFKMYASVMPR